MNPNKRLPGFDFKDPARKFTTLNGIFNYRDGEVNLNMRTVTVENQTRRLRATWTPELTQDLTAYHHVDAEAELTALLAEQVAREIDNNILQDLYGLGGNLLPNRHYPKLVLDIKPKNNLKRHFLVEEERDNVFDFPILPIAMRVTAHTIGNDLVAVQPMGLPMGHLFYLDPLVGEDPVVFDDGSWCMGDTFESTFITSQIKRHEFKF